ncbi:NfeD family protein [Flammeovirgaceae bacterium SG7u.111]|nr:NfeD family protein [Flammeovirgaceae bacterium SG7u.132]WPO33672.1 NfeD family protein [Flammeovirgaceae bacterium SG7u.111]
MIEWVTVITLVLFGLVLLILELIFIPGTTVIGFVGLVSGGYGVYLGYDYFGTTTGTMILAGSIAISMVGFYFSFKSGTWHKFALNQVISSRVNEDSEPVIIGDEGKAISALRPFGSADFGTITKEVRTIGDYVDKGAKIKVIQVNGPNIIVEPVK